MRIAEKDHLDLLLKIYGFYINEIADAIEWDRNSLSNFFKGKSQLITEQMLKSLSNFFNFSINFLIGDDFSYSVKIDNDNFEKDIYIDFNDYIVLKFKGIIVDEYKNKQIIHHYKNEFLYLFENNHIGRSFANIDLIKSIKSIDPRLMIVGPKYDDVGPFDLHWNKTEHYHIEKYRNYRYGDFKKVLIELFCIGGKGVYHLDEYNDLKPKIDYLKATNETVKDIAEEFEDSINLYIDEDIESRCEDPEEDDFDPDDICREDYVDPFTASDYLFNYDYLELINIFINSLI